MRFTTLRWRFLALVLAATTVGGCATTPTGPDRDAGRRLDERLMADYAATIDELDRTGPDDSFARRDRAKALYFIGLLAHDRERVAQAVDLLEGLIAEEGEDAETLVYLGSSYALLARDYPLKWLWYVIPGPGFQRIYYVKKGVALMERAAEREANRPDVSLIRGLTLASLPAAFTERENGLKILDELVTWIDHPEKTGDYRIMVEDPTFRAMAWYRIAEAYEADGRHEEAARLFERVATSEGGGLFVHAARERLNG